MKRLPVQSEALASIGYNAKRRLLQIEFTSGEVYDYVDVPSEVFQELLEAESHGRYFQEHVREQYQYIRLV